MSIQSINLNIVWNQYCMHDELNSNKVSTMVIDRYGELLQLILIKIPSAQEKRYFIDTA